MGYSAIQIAKANGAIAMPLATAHIRIATTRGSAKKQMLQDKVFYDENRNAVSAFGYDDHADH